MSRSMGDIWWRERENKTLTNHAFSAKNRSNKEEIYDRAVNEYKRWKRIKLRKKRGKNVIVRSDYLHVMFFPLCSCYYC